MPATDPTILWNDLAARGNAHLDVDQHRQLWRFIDLLLEANQRMNLTRIASRDEAALLHVADALTLLPLLPAAPHRAADVGSGGGVPGIPLAIARPDTHVTLIESTRKKAAFLDDAVARLEIPNVAVDPRRAEDVAHSEARESFDVAIARAVATLDWLAEWCLPLVRVGGAMLAMKGPKVHDELPDARRAIKLCGGAEPSLHAVELPGTSGHVIVSIRKLARTDARYPRPATHARGKPLR
jgi:16S rRNA (guanine527-N7)-methyltransferase